MPYPLLDRVKCEIELMVTDCVIFPVDQPSDWCSLMLVVPEGNNKIRICIDCTELNSDVKRKIYLMAHVESSLAVLESGKIFTKLDAKSGFTRYHCLQKQSCLPPS